MKKQLLLFAMILLPLVASAHHIAVQNADGVTFYYNYINNGTELEVTFRGFESDSYSNEYQGNVVIPEEVTYMNRICKVTSIGKSAFIYCSGLTSITIPNSVTSIGNNAFAYCSGLKKVIVKDIAAWCGIKFDGYLSNPLRYAKHLYSDENTEITNLIIPNSVTSIGHYAFYGCSGLTSVTIPNSVTSIGISAFRDCSGLKKVIVKDIAAWCGIKFDGSDSNPLFYAHHLYSDENTEITNLVIPNSVTSIGKSAFAGCSGLTSVTIPNSVMWIRESAFYGCSGLTSVTIPTSVKSIGDWAFEYCSGLTSITIPNSVTSIGLEAFRDCSGLTSVTIGNSVTSIRSQAFRDCSGLTSVTIGSGIKYIESSAFASCPELTDVTCYAENVPSTKTDAFKDSYIEYATLHVPASAVNAYKAADPWKNFKSIIEANPTGIKTIENTQSKNTTIYDLNGVRQSVPKKGINIINGKKVVIK